MCGQAVLSSLQRAHCILHLKDKDCQLLLLLLLLLSGERCHHGLVLGGGCRCCRLLGWESRFNNSSLRWPRGRQLGCGSKRLRHSRLRAGGQRWLQSCWRSRDRARRSFLPLLLLLVPPPPVQLLRGLLWLLSHFIHPPHLPLSPGLLLLPCTAGRHC